MRRGLAASVYRVPDGSHGLLRLFQECVALSERSLSAFAVSSGIPPATLSRRLRAVRCRESERVEALLACLGITIVCVDARGGWHPILRPVDRPFRRRAVPIPAPLSCASLSAVLRHAAKDEGLSLRGLARASGTSFAAARRSLRGDGGAAGRHLLRALQAGGYRLLAITRDGDAVRIESDGDGARDGGAMAAAHRAALTRYRQRHCLRLPTLSRRGRRLRICPDRVLDLYHRHGLDCQRIAGAAGVTGERVRQILLAAGVAPLRAGRVQQRRAAMLPRLLYVPAE